MTRAPTPHHPLPPLADTHGEDPQKKLYAELLGLIRDAIAREPRSQQTWLGPSEIGHSCDRWLVYRLLGTETVNTTRPVPWRPYVGSAVHRRLEEVFTAANAGHEVVRWLTEQTVDVGEVAGRPVLGSADLFDQSTNAVVDWKVLGKASLDRLRRSGQPSAQYRAQLHLYGRGFRRRGLPVDRVVLAGLPAAGEFSDAVFWAEAYDEQVAVDALQRANELATIAADLGPAALPLVPTYDVWCGTCPFYREGSTDPTTGCPGDPGRAVRRDPVQELLVT